MLRRKIGSRGCPRSHDLRWVRRKGRALAGLPACARRKNRAGPGPAPEGAWSGRNGGEGEEEPQAPVSREAARRPARDRASPERGHDDAARFERGAISGDVSLPPRAISERAGVFKQPFFRSQHTL